jgi:polyisoprenoid-binding protein YceI
MMQIKNLQRKYWLFTLSVIVFTLISVQYSHAETSLRATEVSVRVTGTSTMHDWEMVSDKADSEVQFILNDQGQPERMESVVLRLSKTSLRSERAGLASRAHDAMKADKHPEIIFVTNGSGSVEKNGDSYNITTSGDLTIAGVTRQVSVEAICVNGDEDKLICTGSSELKMSDFNVDPPSMALGAFRTGDEITIEYRVAYTK